MLMHKLSGSSESETFLQLLDRSRALIGVAHISEINYACVDYMRRRFR